jgi:ribosomal protein L44E
MCQKITQTTVNRMDLDRGPERERRWEIDFFRRERRGNEWIGVKGSLVRSRGEKLTKILKLRFGPSNI